MPQQLQQEPAKAEVQSLGTPAPAKDAGNEGLSKAIDSDAKDGKLDRNAFPGFLVIPGAPSINVVMAFCRAIWVGWIFYPAGAFGNVMAPAGHTGVHGLGDDATSFGKGHPLNKLMTDSIRMSNQWMAGTSSLISSLKYRSLGHIVLPLGAALGIGFLAGSILAPILSQGKVSFRDDVGFFDIFPLGLGICLRWQTLPMSRARSRRSTARASPPSTAPPQAS